MLLQKIFLVKTIIKKKLSNLKYNIIIIITIQNKIINLQLIV